LTKYSYREYFVFPLNNTYVSPNKRKLKNHQRKEVSQGRKIASGIASTIKKKGKKATFAEAVSAETPLQPETSKKEGVVYQKCIVGFAIRVDKGQKSKEIFDKKVGEALFFLRTHIDEESCFLPLSANKILGPIKEKSDMPKFQVTSRKYFSIPHPQAFSPVTQDGGRIIKGSGIMGFQGDPQTCLDEAAGDLRMLNCSIFYKKCQKVDTVAKLMLLGAPNLIDEQQIFKVMDKELRDLEEDEKKDSNSNVNCFNMKEWVKYTITKE
jgi:hypothetical protein